ncbi:hypothetical protein EMCRGX_G001495 [Ephydatia muelleri]
MPRLKPTVGGGIASFLPADSLQLFTYASGSIGFGTYYNGACSRVTGSHNNASHSIPYSGMNCMPSWLLLAHGVTAGHAYILPGFLPRFQADPSPWHKRNYYTVCSPPQPVHEPEDHIGACGSSLLPAPLPWVQESCFQEPNAETWHTGSPTPPGASSPQAYITATDSGNAGSHAAEVGDSPPENHNCLMLRAALTFGFFSFLRGRDTCPVAAMEAYRECCRCSTHSTPLFHFRDGRPLTPKSFCSTFESLVDQCGYDPAKYNTHSLRIGAATVAAFPLTPS